MVKCQYSKNLQYHAKLYGSVAFIYSVQIFRRLNHSVLFISNLTKKQISLRRRVGMGGGGGEKGGVGRDGGTQKN